MRTRGQARSQSHPVHRSPKPWRDPRMPDRIVSASGWHPPGDRVIGLSREVSNKSRSDISESSRTHGLTNQMRVIRSLMTSYMKIVSIDPMDPSGLGAFLMRLFSIAMLPRAIREVTSARIFGDELNMAAYCCRTLSSPRFTSRSGKI